MQANRANRQAINEDRQDHQVSFKTKNRIVNLLFQNRELTDVTYCRIIACFCILSIIFLGLSFFFFIQVSSVMEYKQIYYSVADNNCFMGSLCSVTLNVEKVMKKPVYLMYELGNFYQNHRRYIQSRSNYQLNGNQINQFQAGICQPYILNSDIGATHSWNGTQLDPDAVANPCGAIAYTFFNDTFSLYLQNTNSQTQIPVDQTGISWPGDQGGKFKRADNSSNIQWIDPENEHFIVWMRTSGLPNFKKLWGTINVDLQAGSYKVLIKNNYNSTNWNGDRYVMISTKSLVGGKNFLLPIAFVVIGVINFIIAIVFWKRFHSFQRIAQNQRSQ